MKAHLHYQEVIIYLNTSLKSVRHSVVLVSEDRFPSCAMARLFVFFFIFHARPLPAWPAEGEGLGASLPAVIDRHSVGVDHPLH